VAVGASTQVRSFAGKRTRVTDAKGMTIVPGFIDAHHHPIGTTHLYEVLVGNPFEVEFVSIDVTSPKSRFLPSWAREPQGNLRQDWHM